MARFTTLSLALALAATSVNAATKSLRAPVVFDNRSRQLSYEFIAGYRPESEVTDHNAIDLDQAALEVQIAKKTQSAFDIAKAIYEQGAHSKSYAILTFDNTVSDSFTDGTEFVGTSATNQDVRAKVYKSSGAAPGTIQLQYLTTSVQETYVECQVGALSLSGDANIKGCFAPTGTITDGTNTYAYTYDPQTANKNGRTIKGFSTAVEAKMISGCKGCPYTDATYFKNYYGDADYGHKWVDAAFGKKETNFKSGRGDADFSEYGFVGQGECIKKGTAYIIIFMYVIREFEDALDDCSVGCINCNDDPVHAWDEGVAFYSGSLEGVNGDTSGKLLHQLADKRCGNFGTCLEDGTSSKLNDELFNLFNVGQGQLLVGKCDEARETTKKIADLMYVPLIQGTLRYAYKVGELGGAEKEKAEGAVFAAGVLPKVHEFDPKAAETIYSSMGVGASSTSFSAVKKAFEGVYKDMGISCSDIGGLLDPEGNYYGNAKPCSSGAKSSVLGAALGGTAAGIAVIAIGVIFWMRRREVQGKPVFSGPESSGVE